MLPGQLELTPAPPPQLAIPCRPQICVHLGDDSSLRKREKGIFGIPPSKSAVASRARPLLLVTWRDLKTPSTPAKQRHSVKPNRQYFGRVRAAVAARQERGEKPFDPTLAGQSLRRGVNRAAARFRSPRGARRRNAEFLIRYEQLEIHVSHRQHETNSNSNPQIQRCWPGGFGAFVAHCRAKAERRSSGWECGARAENFRRYGII